MKKIMLTIIVPVYNAKKYLKECLDSILDSKENIEILIIDDGSTDGSETICDEYEKIDTRINVIHKVNGGVSSARNYGIKKSKGKYIMFVDADDVLVKNWDRCLKEIKEDDVYYITRKIDSSSTKKDLLTYIIGNNSDKIFISGPYCKAFKRKFIIENSLLFNEKLINGEDMIFNLQALLSLKSYSILNYSIYKYRQSLIQATRRFNNKIIESDKTFHKVLDETLIIHGVDGYQAIEIKNYCLCNAVKLLLNRISYIDKYKSAKSYFNFVKEYPYCRIVGKNNNIILWLLNKHNYKIVFYYYKIRNKFSRVIKNKKKREFIEI